MNPRFPIYIVSKGRSHLCITMRHLDAMRVPYLAIVEEQEHRAYADAIGSDKLLVLDEHFQDTYDTCDELGSDKSKGPGAARNFAWEHSIAAGAAWHWVLDDNIQGFCRLYRNAKIKVSDGTVLRCMEDFTLRYKNIGMVGPNYDYFAKRKQHIPPYVTNTRIYSCNLIRNDLPFRWRGRYNEDTDLSLRMLKAGWCTVQFNAFLQNKITTQTNKGGNTEAFYSKEGTLPKSAMITRLHPDVSRLVWKFGRWHHHVDYRPFARLRLIRRDDIHIPQGADDYGMRLVEVAA